MFWGFSLLTLPVWMRTMSSGWDARVYDRALHWTAAGRDPYAEGIAQEEAYEKAVVHPDGATEPFAYVYSPMTLRLLRVLALVPDGLRHVELWFLYALGALAQILVTMRMAADSEKKWIALLAPAAIYFPGMLHCGVILSGNIAYLLYGLVLTTALFGWRRGQWLWFYAAVLIASCFKAPYLCLLAIPVFSARRQWLPAGMAAGAGVALFAGQSLFWPSEFAHYLLAVEKQFSLNHDFGASPAGVLGYFLQNTQGAFEFVPALFYFGYAALILLALGTLSRRYLRGELSAPQYLPVLLIGVILLNPRHIEYDLAPLTLPIALVGMRLLGWATRRVVCCTLWLGLVSAANVAIIEYGNGLVWRMSECSVLVVCFAGGCWQLRRQSAVVPARDASQVHGMRHELVNS
jgi:hypothetical protein